ARRALEQEQPGLTERVEVDRVPTGERPDRLEREGAQVHQALRSAAATSSYARRSTSTSAGVGRWPVTCARKSAVTSSGSCAAVTTAVRADSAETAARWWTTRA